MAKDWTAVHAEIHSLYHVRKLPLFEVMSLVQDKYGFIASERSYRTQLLKWGYTKYNTQAHPKPERYPKRRSNVRRDATDAVSAASAPSAPSAALVTSHHQHDNTVLPSASGTQGTSTRHDNTALLSASGTEDTSTRDLGSSNSISSGRPSPRSASRSWPPAPHPGLLSLLSHYSTMSPFLQANDGKSLLHRAVIRNDVEFVRASLSMRTFMDATDDFGNTPLHEAVRADLPLIIGMLLNSGVKADARAQHGRSPLHLAADLGHLEAVKVLVEGGADVSIQDSCGDTPLHLALREFSFVMAGTASVVEALVEAGADVNKANGSGRTPFLNLMCMPYAQQREDRRVQLYDLILLFLRRGGDVSKPLASGLTVLQPEHDQTPLELFLSRTNLQRALQTPHPPASNKENEILRRFLQSGSLAAAQDSSVEPLLVEYFSNHYARDDADLELAKIFCQQCSPHHILREGGGTLLHLLLAHCGRGVSNTYTLVELLLSRGADPNRRDHDGQTPLSLLLGSNRDADIAAQTAHALVARGAWVAPRDIFEAGEHFSTSEEIVRKLFQAYIKQMGDMFAGPLRYLLPVDEQQQRWWRRWRLAAESGAWNNLQELITDWNDSVYPGIDSRLAAISYAVLVDALVDASRSKMQRELVPSRYLKDMERKYIAGMLHACRLHGYRVSTGCFDYLLELCL